MRVAAGITRLASASERKPALGRNRATRTAAGTSDYVLYAFRLTSARTSEIVWEDMAEIKKQGLDDAAYR